VIVLWVTAFLLGIVLFKVLLYLTIWLAWNTRGINLIYIYSNSPTWQEHVEKDILPHLPRRAIVLNWSERKKWRLTLATLAFYHFAGYHDFNPMAIVFCPLRPARVFRFLRPFREFKHGKPEALQKMEMELFALLNR
jgi:hypothetical protein